MFQTHLPFIGINLVLQDEFVQQVCTASSISHQPFKFLFSKTVSMCQYRIGHNPYLTLFAHIKTRTGCRQTDVEIVSTEQNLDGTKEFPLG